MEEHVNTDKCIGKRILAGEPIYQFSTGKLVGWTRRRCIGVVKEIDNGHVYVYDRTNPEGYKNYELSLTDFCRWVHEKLYVLRR